MLGSSNNSPAPSPVNLPPLNAEQDKSPERQSNLVSIASALPPASSRAKTDTKAHQPGNSEFLIRGEKRKSISSDVQDTQHQKKHGTATDVVNELAEACKKNNVELVENLLRHLKLLCPTEDSDGGIASLSKLFDFHTCLCIVLSQTGGDTGSLSNEIYDLFFPHLIEFSRSQDGRLLSLKRQTLAYKRDDLYQQVESIQNKAREAVLSGLEKGTINFEEQFGTLYDAIETRDVEYANRFFALEVVRDMNATLGLSLLRCTIRSHCGYDLNLMSPEDVLPTSGESSIWIQNLDHGGKLVRIFDQKNQYIDYSDLAGEQIELIQAYTPDQTDDKRSKFISDLTSSLGHTRHCEQILDTLLTFKNFRDNAYDNINELLEIAKSSGNSNGFNKLLILKQGHVHKAVHFA